MESGGENMALNQELRDLIDEIAKAVRLEFDVSTPVDIDEIVKKMGGNIISDPNLDQFADGKIRKTGDETFEIRVSSYQSVKRRKFTIAHELGHLFLHMGFMTNPKIWENQEHQSFNIKGNSDVEYQANEFAAAFLMPKEEYKVVMDQNTSEDGTTVYTSRIADYFGVSVDTASNRGKWLGYLEW